MADTCNCPPSPIPPRHRPVQTVAVQTITGNGVISLNEDTTYFDSTSDVAVTLPDGNYLRQIKRIYIKKEDLATTGTFTITGTFTGFTGLTMNSVAQSAVLEWDGTGWQLIGGNAQPWEVSTDGGTDGGTDGVPAEVVPTEDEQYTRPDTGDVDSGEQSFPTGSCETNDSFTFSGDVLFAGSFTVFLSVTRAEPPSGGYGSQYNSVTIIKSVASGAAWQQVGKYSKFLPVVLTPLTWTDSDISNNTKYLYEFLWRDSCGFLHYNWLIVDVAIVFQTVVVQMPYYLDLDEMVRSFLGYHTAALYLDYPILDAADLSAWAAWLNNTANLPGRTLLGPGGAWAMAPSHWVENQFEEVQELLRAEVVDNTAILVSVASQELKYNVGDLSAQPSYIEWYISRTQMQPGDAGEAYAAVTSTHIHTQVVQDYKKQYLNGITFGYFDNPGAVVAGALRRWSPITPGQVAEYGITSDLYEYGYSAFPAGEALYWDVTLNYIIP